MCLFYLLPTHVISHSKTNMRGREVFLLAEPGCGSITTTKIVAAQIGAALNAACSPGVVLGYYPFPDIASHIKQSKIIRWKTAHQTR